MILDSHHSRLWPVRIFSNAYFSLVLLWLYGELAWLYGCMVARLNVTHTNVAFWLNSGSARFASRHASIIRPTPLPQFSKNVVLNSTSAMMGFGGYEWWESLIVSTGNSSGRWPVFSISTRSSYMAIPTELLVLWKRRWQRAFVNASRSASAGISSISSSVGFTSLSSPSFSSSVVFFSFSVRVSSPLIRV